jgi:hypothetical protein
MQCDSEFFCLVWQMQVMLVSWVNVGMGMSWMCGWFAVFGLAWELPGVLGQFPSKG